MTHKKITAMHYAYLQVLGLHSVEKNQVILE